MILVQLSGGLEGFWDHHPGPELLDMLLSGLPVVHCSFVQQQYGIDDQSR